MSIEKNIADRKAAESLYSDICELLKDEVTKLPSRESFEKFFQMLKSLAEKNLPQTVSIPEKPKQSSRCFCCPSTDEALRIATEIENLADEICPNGQDFAESILEKTADIAESVEKANQATNGQIKALNNMLEGLQRWFHD